METTRRNFVKRAIAGTIVAATPLAMTGLVAAHGAPNPTPSRNPKPGDPFDTTAPPTTTNTSTEGPTTATTAPVTDPVTTDFTTEPPVTTEGTGQTTMPPTTMFTTWNG